MEENNVSKHHELDGVDVQIVDATSHAKGADLSQLSREIKVVVEEYDAAMDSKLQATDSHPQERGKEPIEDKDAATDSRLQANDSHSEDRGKKPIGEKDADMDSRLQANDSHSQERGKEPIGNGDMRRRYMDAMALVQRFGHPDIFLTMTCNPDWVEIRRELRQGQHEEDRPDLIARVFHAKLQDLKKLLFTKNIFGEVAARVHVIEFQKRGLPHAHFLIILKRRYKLTNPDQFDRWVAPYNPYLLMWYNCHVNVEICTSIQAVKYLFKYIYKGHDCAWWVSAPEAMWRLYGFTKEMDREFPEHFTEEMDAFEVHTKNIVYREVLNDE